MGKVKLEKYISEFSQKNKDRNSYPVYSVTNSNGFCTEYFTKDVSSEDKRGYKLVPFGYFAYNPSRINVGSVDCQTKEENVIVSPLYTVFKVGSGLNVEYLRYFFKSNYCKYLIQSKVSGSVRFNLKFDTLKTFEINEISNDEQQKAVEIFSSIEDLIKTEEKELSFLNELIKSRFNELFGPIQYMSDSNHSIGDVCELNPRKDSLDDSMEITFIPMEKVGVDGSLKLDLLRKYGDIKKGFSQIRENDVLFAKITPCMENGKATIARGLINGYAGGTTELFVIRCGNEVLPEYIFHIVHSQYFRDKAKPNMRGTVGQQRVGKEFIESFPIDVPNLEKQKEFASFVEQVDKLKFSI